MEKAANVLFSASVSCMDLGNMQSAIEKVENAGIDFLHYDVVDGHFNKCFILGDLMCQYLKKHTKLPVEVHLAVNEPERYIEIFSKFKVEYIAVHYEALRSPDKIFQQIIEAGAKPVLAYRADTAPGDDFVALAEKSAWVLKLTVNPGFAGQKIQPAAIEHIREMSKQLRTAGSTIKIQADGNVNIATMPILSAAGARMFTGGTSGLFTAGRTVKENLSELYRAGGFIIN